ncbi:MAG TPA: hypothetical protein VGN07_18125 [Steroidobacteraceae bacterium]|jgi:hypothetical protein
MKHSLFAIAIISSLSWAPWVLAADPPATSVAKEAAEVSPSTDCSKLTGDARKQCKGSQALGQTHSSSIMDTGTQKAVADAQRKGKDPSKVVEKIRQQEKEKPAKQSTP